MDEATKERARKGGLTTRRTSELLNCIKSESDKSELIEKIETVKYAMENLGMIHDEVMTYIDEKDEKKYTIRINGTLNMTVKQTWR